jgi:glycosyltransferase involved in cell wall biosynthesis
MKLLICSLFVPYDTVNHAGGQIHNYYVKRIKKETQIDMHLVTFASVNEIDLIDLDKYSISNTIITKGNYSFFSKIIKKYYSLIIKLFPNLAYFYSYHKYLLLKELYKLKKNGYIPDIVELNWTEIAFFLSSIKRIFPQAKYYAVEMDVSFLKYERNYLLTTDVYQRKKEKRKYLSFKNKELNVLKRFDKVFTLNEKDKKLLTENGMQESLIKVIVPYFQTVSFPLTTNNKNEILFYGAMGRPENYLAAIWFIENVFSLLNDEFVFVVLGSNPHSSLLKYKNERIIITGYQSDIQPYFERALCLTAPLERGAGVKVKVLEALSAGLPVLGTEVASEGIGITNGVNFLYCKTPTDYYEKIKELYNNTDMRTSISAASKKFIHDNYNFDTSFNEYVDILYSL